MQRPAFLEYRDFRYLRLALALGLLALLGYPLANPAGGGYGGTWYGYGLGIASAGIVLLLGWYGIRKRRIPRDDERRLRQRRRQRMARQDKPETRAADDRRQIPAEDHWRFGGTLQGWLSAHVHLALLLVLLVSLHSGLRLGWNVHSLAFVLVLLITASGLLGTYAYLRYPRLITEALGDSTPEALRARIAELDELARQRALELPDEINALVTRAREQPLTGDGFLRGFLGRPAPCASAAAVLGLQAAARTLVSGEQPRLVRDLYTVMLQRQRLADAARRVNTYEARLRTWLWFHGPLTIALLAALVAHVASVLIYW